MKITYKKASERYWGGNGVGDVPATWTVLVNGEHRYTIKGWANYMGKGYTIVNLDGSLVKEFNTFHDQLRRAKITIERYLEKTK